MTHDIQIFIENAPPRSGKDSVANAAVLEMIEEAADGQFPYNMISTQSFKQSLIEIALTVSGVSSEEWNVRYNEVVAEGDNHIYMKEVPWERLGGLSQREYLIKISEDWVKPVHGEDHFGKLVAISTQSEFEELIEWATHDADEPLKLLVLIPDGGFKEEVQPLFDQFGKDRVHILQWGREGCNYDNDSRDYVMDYPENTHWVGENNGTLQEFYGKFMGVVDSVLKSKGW